MKNTNKTNVSKDKKNTRIMTITSMTNGIENAWRGDYDLITTDTEGKNKRIIGSVSNILGNPDFYGWEKILEMAEEYAHKRGYPFFY